MPPDHRDEAPAHPRPQRDDLGRADDQRLLPRQRLQRRSLLPLPRPGQEHDEQAAHQPRRGHRPQAEKASLDPLLEQQADDARGDRRDRQVCQAGAGRPCSFPPDPPASGGFGRRRSRAPREWRRPGCRSCTRRERFSPSGVFPRPSSRPTTVRWPVELTGRYSVTPSTTPRITAWRMLIEGFGVEGSIGPPTSNFGASSPAALTAGRMTSRARRRAAASGFRFMAGKIAHRGQARHAPRCS